MFGSVLVALTAAAVLAGGAACASEAQPVSSGQPVHDTSYHHGANPRGPRPQPHAIHHHGHAHHPSEGGGESGGGSEGTPPDTNSGPVDTDATGGAQQHPGDDQPHIL